ncbi:MAG: hypothetical protein LBK95_14155 [Bifidobacteriaceae bacterium]|nr:hypothetical protein [Bifidobacteriaceae bacterium]
MTVACNQRVLDGVAVHMMEKIHGFYQPAADALMRALNETLPAPSATPAPSTRLAWWRRYHSWRALHLRVAGK